MLRRTLIGLIGISILLAGCSEKPVTPTRRILPTLTPTLILPTATPLPTETPIWFRQAVVYQIVPRSFNDSNGDGVGDLNGITQKLDYLHDLGVTALWLTPVFSIANPQGYDVTDHFSIAPDIGTQQDLVTLVNEAHRRHMRVIIELAAGRTSNTHPFFLDAKGKPDSFYSDWYLWDNAAHTLYRSASADKSDPVLNLVNPVVQQYILEVARYWLDLDNDGDLTNGIDGFADNAAVGHPDFWRTLRSEVKQINPDLLLLGYLPERESANLASYYADQFDALLDLPLYSILLGNPDKTGDGVLNGQGAPTLITDHIKRQWQLYPPAAQSVRFASYQATGRIAAEVKHSPERQKQIAALILTLPGTPLIYYGEEIGMTGGRLAKMDWNAVAAQQGQLDSALYAYRQLIGHRRNHAALDVGCFETAVAAQCPTCLAYWRWDENDFYLLLFNFSNSTQATTIDFTIVPRPVRGAGEDVLRGGTVSVPSNGRYTLTIEANGLRILHWGKP